MSSNQSTPVSPNSLANLRPWQKGQSGNPGGFAGGNNVRVDVAYKRLIALAPDEFAQFKPTTIAEVMAYRQVCEAIASKKPLAYAQEVTNRTDGPLVRKVEKTDMTALAAEKARFEAAIDALVGEEGCTRAEAAAAIISIEASFRKFVSE